MKLPLYLISILYLGYVGIRAQELNCEVRIVSDRVQTQDQRIFQDMERQFTQFLNEKKWTEDDFDQQERIKCNLVVTIDRMPAIGSFQASVQIQSARPVYNASYETLVLNFADRDWSFDYVESQPLEFNPNVFTSNITSLLAYYAYIVIGLDYDTFAEKGGDRYLQLARDIVTNAQPSGRPGWSPFDGGDRNRYWLIESILNQQFETVRIGYYLYHRQGLDILQEQPEKVRDNILEMIKALKQAQDIKPNNIYVTTFLDSKADEIIQLFSEGDLNKRKEAYNILIEVDPSRQDDYKNIL